MAEKVFERERLLASMDMKKLMIKLSLPAVIAQLVNVLYNVVDRIYIGHMPQDGTLALTALGICFPVLLLISSLSALIGYGGAPIAAIELGKGDRKKADRILGNCVTMILFTSIIVMISLQIYKVPLLMSFGASKNTIGFASDYLQVYIYGTIFVQVSIGLNMFISSQGEAKTAMFSVIIGTVCNIILDPIFIFVFNMGVQGAALATVISQGISNIWILKFLLGPKTSIKIRRENLHLDSAIIGPVLALGIAPFIMQSTESLVNIVYNTQLHTLGGDNFVGAMTILTSIRMFLKAPIGGFANGVQPIISYNYGAGNNARVRDCYKKLLLTSVLFTTVVNILLYFFPGFFIGLFTNSPDLISISRHYLPIFTATFWIFGIQMASQNTFLGLNCPKQSLFIALLRKVICIIPLTFILPHFLGIAGVFWAEPISDTISATTSLILCILLLKNSVKVDTAKSRQ